MGPDVQRLINALGSPLRLRLVAELFSADQLTADEAVRRTGRHRTDVVACLDPLVAWGVLERDADGETFRLHPELPGDLRSAMEGVLERRSELVEREQRVRGQVLCGMIGVDPKMAVIFEGIQLVARLDMPVLITGETGTGKELVARAIHELSGRRERAFGEVNCATLSEQLFASEMFGHVRGAFTGAVRDHVGMFESGDGGTVFLDEVGELSLANQVKLLRVLQQRSFSRVGETRIRHSDFRLICATNRDLDGMVAEGGFREDLFYRINVFPMRLPSLRERLADLPYLAEELLRVRSPQLGTGAEPPTVSERALDRLRAHPWPGNVRELENVLARAAVLAGGELIEPQHLPELTVAPAGRPSAAARPEAGEDLRPLADVERAHIEQVLRTLEFNISAAAATLGISRTTLYKKLRDHGIRIGRGLVE